MTNFGERLKKVRKKVGWSQVELGKRCVPEMNNAQISQYEVSERVPNYDQLVILKKALNCSFDELMDDTVEEMENKRDSKAITY